MYQVQNKIARIQKSDIEDIQFGENEIRHSLYCHFHLKKENNFIQDLQYIQMKVVPDIILFKFDYSNRNALINA